MRVQEFDFEYPEELVAQEPLLERDHAQLLVVGNTFRHLRVLDLPEILSPGDVVVLNNSKVIPARLFAQRKSGGKVEIFFLEERKDCCEVLLQSSKALKEGEKVIAPGGIEIEILQTGSPGKIAIPHELKLFDYLNKYGNIPLPPYIRRPVRPRDATQYQTIFAEIPGAVAAPTAGLHFTPALLSRLDRKDIEIVYITLHVGLGTFQPVRSENIHGHKMHSERFEISEWAWEKIKGAEQVVAVGTTTVRALETAAKTGKLNGRTELFITPGFRFSIVNLLMTNFHQPKSTLLMLVSAFAGLDRIRHAYREAIEKKYRLFSYGDAMLLEKRE
ncbi:MAG TPA: tRNA preQ1(34) S-adenosylmethionine ribosyltransferase-isomerase QueA [Bdellovibrionota bacterium]|nr:tRNA preQ1(34) S-adenosylmethionine ribosyltransferase-isomerase QueA [Bdellovibrionota bacterium]